VLFLRRIERVSRTRPFPYWNSREPGVCRTNRIDPENNGLFSVSFFIGSNLGALADVRALTDNRGCSQEDFHIARPSTVVT